jgi:hypothetical protein
MHEWIETITVFDVKDHQAARGVPVELGAYQFIVLVPWHIKKVDSDGLSLNLQFFYSIIDSNSLNVAFNEFFFAITLDETTFANFGITYTDNFKGNLLSRGLASIVACRWLCWISGIRSVRWGGIRWSRFRLGTRLWWTWTSCLLVIFILLNSVDHIRFLKTIVML